MKQQIKIYPSPEVVRQWAAAHNVPMLTPQQMVKAHFIYCETVTLLN